MLTTRKWYYILKLIKFKIFYDWYFHGYLLGQHLYMIMDINNEILGPDNHLSFHLPPSTFTWFSYILISCGHNRNLNWFRFCSSTPFLLCYPLLYCRRRLSCGTAAVITSTSYVGPQSREMLTVSSSFSTRTALPRQNISMLFISHLYKEQVIRYQTQPVWCLLIFCPRPRWQ